MDSEGRRKVDGIGHEPVEKVDCDLAAVADAVRAMASAAVALLVGPSATGQRNLDSAR